MKETTPTLENKIFGADN